MIPFADILEDALIRLGYDSQVSYRLTDVGGGCISRTSIVELGKGERFFIKQNRVDLFSMFEAEALALEELYRKPGPSVPRPLVLGKNEEYAFILMEYLPAGQKEPDFWQTFGENLAQLHLSDPGEGILFGWRRENFIGSSRQINTPEEKWVSFFGNKRLRIQGEWALQKRYIDPSLFGKLESLIDKLDQRIKEPQRPEFLHGDLWSGNYYIGPDNRAWLIDPAVYYGCGEAELAMTEMFGGFPESFYKAYDSVRPIDPSYTEQKDVYNLYHYLNHLNLFGSSYYSSVAAILQRYC